MAAGSSDGERVWRFCFWFFPFHRFRAKKIDEKKKTHFVSFSPPLLQNRQYKKGTAYVWDSKTAALEYALPGHSGSVNDVCFHPTEPVIASASSDGSLFVGELAS